MTLKRLIMPLTFLAVFASFAPLFGGGEFVTEILEQARHYVFLFTALLFVAGLALRYSFFYAVLLFCALVGHIWVFLGAYPVLRANQEALCTGGAASLRVLTHNIFYKNGNEQAVVDNILASKADIVVLQEAQQTFLSGAHVKMSAHYPFVFPNVSEGEFYSPAIFSKYPITSVEKPMLPLAAKRFLQVELEIEGQDVDFLAVHTVSPQNAQAVKIRNVILQDLANYVQRFNVEGRDFIIAGDFNSVPWHPKMRAVLRQGGLAGNPDIMNFFGTWPEWGAPLLFFPIDHVFYSGNFTARAYGRGVSAAGSDHFPVIADLTFCLRDG